MAYNELKEVISVKRQDVNMLEGPLYSSILLYTIPIILTSLLQLLFNAADLVVVGRFCGSVSVAAVGATNAITNLMVNFFIGMSIGVGVTVAHGLGSKEPLTVHNSVHTAIPAALCAGLVLSVLGITFCEPLLRRMGTPEAVLPLSVIYMRICFSGAAFNMLYNYCAAILRAAGDTRSPLMFLTLTGIVNVVLNVLFVTVWDMNVAGVALATILSQALSAGLVIQALMKRSDDCRLELKKLRFHLPQLNKILSIGIPAGIQSSLFSIANVMVQSAVNSFGQVYVSGYAAASSIDGFIYTSANAYHQTSVNFVGQNVGARQYSRVYRILQACLVCAIGTSLLTGTTAYVFGPQLLALYLPDSPEAVACGLQRLNCVALLYFLSGMMDVSTGALRGMGKSFLSMVISVLGVCVLRIGWIHTVFQIYHTPEVLYIMYPLSWGVTFLVQITVFLILYRKFIKKAQP